MTKLELDGHALEVEPGITILAAARRAGIEIPTLCHDSRLKPASDCRLCLVDVDGSDHPRPACMTSVADGMRVRTETPALHAFRTQLLTWAAERVAPQAYEAWPDKELHRLLRAYGLDPKGKEAKKKDCDLSHPYIRVDMSQCITCFRCVRICNEVQGQFVWHAMNRGEDTHIVPDSGTTLAASSCVGCGACVDSCPTGALTDRSGIRPPKVERWTRTTCVYCGVGCELEVGTASDQIVRTRPVVDAPVNKGHLCIKGRYASGFTHAKDRVLHPMLRKNGSVWERTAWTDVLDHCADELKRIVSTYGPDAVGVLGSARATNEDNYVAQKFARVVLGTNNVDCCARVCHTPTAAAMKAMLGTGAATNAFNDIEKAQTILVVGANPTECHPIIGARIKQRVLSGGANLIVIDPRRIELARLATHHLAPRSGTNIPLLNAIAHVIVNEELADRDFIQSRISEWAEFQAFIAAWTPERASEICGVPSASIRAAARLYATAKPSLCVHGLGVTEHTQGTEGVMALVNLALLTGNIGRPGTGINPLRGQNNVQGAAQMGCDPSILTGSVAIDERRALFESVWGTPIPRRRGLDLLAMMDAAAAGRLKALWVIGYDILPTLANIPSTRRALAKLEFVIVQDLFLTKTAQGFGHVVLPAASVFEKDGTFMNAERRIQRVRKAVASQGDAWPDWRITCELAKRMGYENEFDFKSPEAIWNEIRSVWPEGAGISYARLEQQGLQWPCRDEHDPGTTVLHVSRFARSQTAALARIDYVATPEQTTPEFPFLLTTGRNLYHFNAGTMTMRTRNRVLRKTDTLDLAPADAARLGIRTNDRVRIKSRYGEIVMFARATDSVSSGQAFATFHDPRTALNTLTSPLRDGIVRAPEYKVTAVSIEPAQESTQADDILIRDHQANVVGRRAISRARPPQPRRRPE